MEQQQSLLAGWQSEPKTSPPLKVTVRKIPLKETKPTPSPEQTQPTEQTEPVKQPEQPEQTEPEMSFEGLGPEIKNDKGLAGLHEKRNANLGQFFTPLPVVKLITDILQIPGNATVLDNTAGSGRMGYHLKGKTKFTAIEVEPEAFKRLSEQFPESQTLNDDAILHITDLEGRFDYALLNPPFSLNWKDKQNKLIHKGYGGSVLSHIACIEIGIRALCEHGIIAFVAPSNIWELESSRLFHRWVKAQTTELVKIKLPNKKLFAGTEWECSVFILAKGTHQAGDPLTGEFQPTFTEESFQSGSILIRSSLQSDEHKQINDIIKSTGERADQLMHSPIWVEKATDTTSKKGKIHYSFNTGRHQEEEEEKKKEEKETKQTRPDLTATVSNNKDRLAITTKSREASIRVAYAKTGFNPKHYNYTTKDYEDEWETRLTLSNLWSENKQCMSLAPRDISTHEIIKALKKQGLEVTISKQLTNYIQNKRTQFLRERAPFEHWIRDNNTEETSWMELYNTNGIRNSLLYKETAKKLDRLETTHPWVRDLYNFQRDDIIRMAIKRRSINATEQGLGKTRELIATALLKGCKHSLFVIPSHLTHNWEEELNQLSLTNQTKIIRKESDVYDLKKINIITYSTLRKPFKSIKSKEAREITERKIQEVTESILLPKDKRTLKKHIRSFADALARRFQFIGFDEAHYLSNKTSLQTIAAYKLRARNMIMMTGTPIGNTVKNIYALLDILYKSKSPYFPYTTTEFREKFVTVEWVTPEFDDTLSSGRTAQQMANVANPDEFKELMAPKWLRRKKAEPEVRADVKIPKPIFKEVVIQPDDTHAKFYGRHLEHFAEVFKEYLHPEDEDHRIDTSVILALLQNLQFVSTIPQHKKCNVAWEYEGDTTELQNRITNIIYTNQDKKIILFTQRPALCDLLSDNLTRQGIKSVKFTGNLSLDRRNRNLSDFKYNGVNVMLASINVTDTGLNIPQANMAILAEPDWKYSKMEQAFSRILRPQTKGSPEVFFLRNEGFIDDYMWQHCLNKKDSNAEVLDFGQTPDSNWTHWKDFTIKMLEDRGLMER